MPYITGEDRDQMIMFPAVIDEYISEENEVRVVDAFVETLNIEELGFVRFTAADRGRPGFRSKDMLKLYIYGFLNRVRSSRKLEKECVRNVEVMWLLKKLSPDYKTIADFRRDNSKALKNVFKQFNIICRQWDLFGKEVVAVDGSKFKASNSKKNNFSDKKLTRQLKYINEKTDEYMKMLDENDSEESDNRKLSADEIKVRINQLNERKAKYEDMRKRLESSENNEISTVDADSRMMYSNNNGVDISYNVQATVDMKHNLVADIEVINNPSDSGQLLPMAERAKKILAVDELTVLADKGYSNNHKDLVECENKNITVYAAMQEKRTTTGDACYSSDKFKYDDKTDKFICPQGKELSYWRIRKVNEINYRDYANFNECGICPQKANCTTSKKGRTICRSEFTPTIEAIEKRMRENPGLYKKRQMMNEPVFGTIKRAMGFTYFLTRGFEKVGAESALAFCAYNMRRVINIMGTKEIIRRFQAA